MKVKLEYGKGFMEVNLPDKNTDVFIAGETVLDPPVLENIYEETKKSILNPIGLKPIVDQVGPGSKVAIVFPDRVKGGFQKDSHRKISIPIIIEECLKAGVDKKDIKLICSNGLHRKNKPDEIKSLLGEKLFNEYYPTGQIVNHDSEDRNNLVDLVLKKNLIRVSS